MMFAFEFELGESVRDRLTGCCGTLVSVIHRVCGPRVSIQPNALKDGRPVDEVWMDGWQLERVAEHDAPPSEAIAGG